MSEPAERSSPVRRRLASTAVALVLAAGCADDGTPNRADAVPGETTATSERGTDAEGVAAAGAAVDDSGRLGSAGDVLLSPAMPRIAVEVDSSPDATLRADARAVLAEELREHGGKRSVAPGADSAVPGRPVYTAADLRRIAAEHRGTHSTADRPAIYVLVLEGRYEDERATGVAFLATAFAVFPEQISGGPLGINERTVETAVLVHELGHLFGLVDLTGLGAFHEDPEHPGHSRYEGSVMYWAVEDVSVINILRGGPPREFDEADEREMARIRSR